MIVTRYGYSRVQTPDFARAVLAIANSSQENFDPIEKYAGMGMLYAAMVLCCDETNTCTVDEGDEAKFLTANEKDLARLLGWAVLTGHDREMAQRRIGGKHRK